MRILRFSVLVPVIAASVAAQAPKSADGAVEPKEWSVPWKGTRPRDAFIDQVGRVWFCGQEGDYVAYLDTKSGEFKRYTIDANSHPHNLVVDAKGMVWFTGNTNGRLVKLEPSTGKLTTFLMPDSMVKDPHTMTFNKAGDAWFTAQNAGVVGKFTQKDGTIRLWAMEKGSRPYGIVLDSHERPYFDLFGKNRIGTIDPA